MKRDFCFFKAKAADPVVDISMATAIADSSCARKGHQKNKTSVKSLTTQG
jgi:hypothetical protein